MKQRMEQTLAVLQEENLYRTTSRFDSPQTTEVVVEGEALRLYCSNAYLDLCNEAEVCAAGEKAIREFGMGSGGSRLTTGTTRLHEELEAELAAFKGREAALVYNTGYMANVGILSALATKGDVIYSDALNHASIIDGCRLSGAQIVVYAHNDMKDLEDKILQHPGQTGIIVSDGVFSMDGDIVNLPELVRLGRQYGLLTMIDEAHATGVIGPDGGGTESYYGCEGSVDVLMGTLSKAIGVEGGFVCGSKQLIAYLKNKSRSFIFSTAMSPASAGAAIAAIRLIKREPERVHRLQENIRYFCEACNKRGIAASSQTAIIPIIIGDEARAMAVMAKLRQRGYFISAIRYPTVGRGSARLRIALMSSHTREGLEGLAEALSDCLGQT